MHNSIDITFVSSAFIFMPPKEAKNIAPGVNPGDSIPVPTSSEGATDTLCFCHSFGVDPIYHMNPGLTPGAIIIGPFRAVCVLGYFLVSLANHIIFGAPRSCSILPIYRADLPNEY
jgi:hypothetical protein